MMYFPLVVLQFINHCFADKRPHSPSIFNPSKRSLPAAEDCPEMTASFLSRILFVWFEHIIWQGYRRPLTEDDVFELDPQETTKCLSQGFDNYWMESVKNGQRQLQNEERKKGEKSISSRRTNGSVFPAMVKAFGGPFWFAGALKLVIDLLSFAPPFVLG